MMMNTVYHTFLEYHGFPTWGQNCVELTINSLPRNVFVLFKEIIIHFGFLPLSLQLSLQYQCFHFWSRWAVLDYEFFPESPMLVCTDCLKEFCYTKNAKRGPFRLFPYLQLICEIPLCSEQVSKSIKMP